MFNFPKDFYSDVRIEHNYSSYIRIKDGRLEEIKESTNTGAFIRLFDGEKWYYTSTTDLKSIDKELANLASFATPNPDINNHPVVLKFQKNTGKIGISGCIGETDINELYKKAEQNLEYQIDYPVEPTKNLESHTKIDICKISNREFYGKIENILKELSRLHPNYIVSNKVYLRQSDYSMENELGMDLSYSDKYILSSLFMKEKNLQKTITHTFLHFLEI